MPEKINERSIYELLHEYLADNNYTDEQIGQFYEMLRVYLCYGQKSQIESDLKRTVKSKAVKNKNAAERRRRRFARLLYTFKGIPFETFGYKREDLFPENSPIFSSEHVVLNIENSKFADGFRKRYTDLIKNYLDQTSKKLVVHDYLGRGRINVPDPDLYEYFQASGKGFEYIEERLEKNDKMSYIRVLGLSIQFLQARKNMAYEFEHIAVEILKQSSVELFTHICNCLRKFTESRSKFYVRPMLSRTYQFAISDDSSIYMESYRLDEEGKAYPSFVEIQKINEHNKQILRIYNNEINDHIRTETRCLTKEKLLRFFEMALDQYAVEYKAGEHADHFTRLETIINEKIAAMNSAFDLRIPSFIAPRQEIP